MVGVGVMEGVSVCVAVGVSVGVYVAVNVAVGLGVDVHTAAVAVWAVAVMVAKAWGEGLQAERSMKARSIRNDLRCIVFLVWESKDLNYGLPVRVVKPRSSTIIRRICRSRIAPRHFANL